MRLLAKISAKGMLLCAGIGLCVPAAAQISLSSTYSNDPQTVVRHDTASPFPDRTPVALLRQDEDPQGIFNRDYGKMLLQDVTHTVTAPVRWDLEDWKKMGLAGAAILGTGLILDRPVRDAVQRNQRSGLDRLADRFEPLGSTKYAAGILGGFYLIGALKHDDKAMMVVQDGLASSLVASVIISPILQDAVGRRRPRDNRGSAAFHPFNEKDASFPSGHTTQAFALASVIAAHYQSPWVNTVAYGTAGLVGFARIYHNAHFTSDVLAGALIGSFVSNSIVAFNQQQRASRVSFVPMLTPGTTGIMMQVRF